MTDEYENRDLRQATAADVLRMVENARKPVSGGAIVSGIGLGDAQLGIAAAFDAALNLGLIVVHHTERGPLHMPHVFYVPAEAK